MKIDYNIASRSLFAGKAVLDGQKTFINMVLIDFILRADQAIHWSELKSMIIPVTCSMAGLKDISFEPTHSQLFTPENGGPLKSVGNPGINHEQSQNQGAPGREVYDLTFTLTFDVNLDSASQELIGGFCIVIETMDPIEQTEVKAIIKKVTFDGISPDPVIDLNVWPLIYPVKIAFENLPNQGPDSWIICSLKRAHWAESLQEESEVKKPVLGSIHWIRVSTQTKCTFFGKSQGTFPGTENYVVIRVNTHLKVTQNQITNASNLQNLLQIMNRGAHTSL